MRSGAGCFAHPMPPVEAACMYVPTDGVSRLGRYMAAMSGREAEVSGLGRFGEPVHTPLAFAVRESAFTSAR